MTSVLPTVDQPSVLPRPGQNQPPAPFAPQPPDGGPPPQSVRPRPPNRPPWRAPTGSKLIVAGIGVLAAVLYTWGLSRNGMANSYYAAAVRSGAKSWKAFFFGSLDPGSFITVDKPPAALWVMDLSARIFGFSSWSMLLPEAAAGVGSVLILHRLVRKWAGDLSAHLAAIALAATPVAVLMFRFNNPDAFLTLVCLAAVWALWSALETGRTRSLILAAVLVGLGFETKMLQAALIVPAMALVYLWAGRPRLRARIAQLAAAGGALILSAGWWVAVVALWPAASRPYIGSTTDNSILSLVFGYNGLSRIFGSGSAGPGSGGGGGFGGGFGGASGVLRLFNSSVGGQVAWLIPLAGAGLVAGLWLTRRGARTDLGRAGWVLWGGWAAVSAAVFSLSKGIFHPYYTVQLAPAVAALAGAGGVALWHLGRRHSWMGWTLPAAVIATAAVAVAILDRTPSYQPWLRTAIVIGAVASAVGLLAARYLPDLHNKLILAVAAAVAALTLLAGPAAYALTTVNQATSGAIVAAGPASAGGGGFGGGGPGRFSAGAAPPGLPTGGGPSGFPGAGQFTPPASGLAGPGGATFGPGGGATTANTALYAYLKANRGGAQYLVATFGSQSSAPIIIATGDPVMTIGGFNGGDPAPTLAQFEKLVAQGKVRYVLIQGTGGGGMARRDSGISQWVARHGTQVPASSYGNDTSSGTLYRVSS